VDRSEATGRVGSFPTDRAAISVTSSTAAITPPGRPVAGNPPLVGEGARRMKILVVHAHPVETSFNAALFGMVVDRLAKAGHAVDALDLYAQGFDPVISRSERLGYHDAPANILPVADHVERLRSADAMVLVFPVWNFGFPALLKGWFDRVFLPGVSFDLVDGKVRPKLHNIGRLAAVTSYGGSRFRAMLVGDPPRRIVKRLLRATIRPGARVDYLAHYAMNVSTDASRARFMRKVAGVMEAF
jgi:putative NADPH-quinone reductase